MEFNHEDFQRTHELQAIVKATLDNLGKEACVPREIYDIIEKTPQALFVYLPKATTINYGDYSLNKFGTYAKKTGNIWDDHQSTRVRVCILESTPEGDLTNLVT